ncbi:YceI family protein [Streptomyces litchfieldiae]|uniref:YceI family protein n=1 Tax=Streptomyces litchfieldiae TaxID=3075543 RepID=A0ABU2MPN2_9ACTN|nr:YceI family protein [Streptomyces sp. DSM 44938]MDT0342863.1 YceI family protein [Streptomyces sp. DSM 44938]
MATQVDIPGYAAGTWVIDTARSNVSFQIRQFGVATRGRFTDFEGTIVTAENPLDSTVSTVIKTASVDTRNERRDTHLRKPELLSVEEHPTMTFTSTGIRADGGGLFVDGDLTVRGVTHPVTLTVDLDSVAGEPLERVTAHTEVSRKAFGVVGPLRVVVSDKVKVTLEIVVSKQG